MHQERLWLAYAIFTVAAWGIWGALMNSTADAGFPETLGYCVWSLTMVPPALIALRLAGWKFEADTKSVLLGAAVGLLGAGGQLILFKTLRTAPAYLVFPFISLSPVVTILMALSISRERASRRGWVGIVLALAAAVLLSYSEPGSGGVGFWVLLALLVFLAWGIQGFVISYANRSMGAESIFAYMAITGLLLAPVALLMTDVSQPVHWGFRGPWMAALIQSLNSVGALCLVYAFRYGKAIIVSPLINAGAPVVTTLLSLALYWTLPHPVHAAGIVLALTATFLMAMEEDRASRAESPGG
jgi:drug/metabolite transporter (DMT)-like permease